MKHQSGNPAKHIAAPSSQSVKVSQQKQELGTCVRFRFLQEVEL